MEIQHYCYTRTNHIDYGDLVLPTGISKRIIDFVRNRVLSITGDISLQLAKPKWLLVKNEELTFWGCCCWNKLLAKEKFKDYSGTPIYGFFAIVLKHDSTDTIKIPYDINYFRELYALEVEPFWHKREEHYNNTNKYIPGKFNCICARSNDYVKLLNTDNFQCLSLGSLDKEGVIAAALTLDNITILFDNDNIEQAINKKGAFMNCLSSSVPYGTYQVKVLCPKCKKYVSSFTSEGICSVCKKEEEDRITTIIKDERNMDIQMKKELEDAKSQILYLQYDIEEAYKKIRKKNLLIKLLITILSLLLFSLSYAYRDVLLFYVT